MMPVMIMNEFMSFDFVIDKIVFACHLRPGEGTPVHKNRPYHGLAFYPAGESVFVFEGGLKLVVGNGAIIYLPKGSDYVVKGRSSGECYAINFDLANSVSFEPFVRSTKDSAFYRQAFHTCESAFEKKQPGYKNLIMRELYGILCKMQKENQIPYQRKTEALDAAIGYIHSHYCIGPIRIGELADLCGISTVYLRKLFISRFGVSPIGYINQLRLSRAKELLESDLYTVKEACFLSGFRDESYFSRKFKEATGLSPSEYKDS